MKQIFLLSPYISREHSYLESSESSLNYLRFYLEDNGYPATVIDCSKYDQAYDTVISQLRQTPNPIVGVTAYTAERFQAYRLVRRIKRELPESLIVAGGHHFGFLPEETLNNLPEVDVVVRGEGELTFKEICDYRFKGTTSLQNIKGISFRENGQIINTPDRPLESNIDLFRNYDPKNAVAYTSIATSKVDPKNKYFTVIASRGCPNKCVFCSLGAKKVRFRTVTSIINEIKTKMHATGIRYVSFHTASLTLRESFIRELCERIIDEQLNIKFNCYSRVNINSDVLQLMKKAGLISVEIGLESGSQKVLKAVKKNIKLEQFKDFCICAKKLGIKIYVFCMISLPDETLNDVNKTIRLIRKMSPYISHAGIQVTRILPDSQMYSIARKRNIIPHDFSWFDEYTRSFKGDVPERYDTLPVYYEYLTPEQVIKKTEEFYSALETFNSVTNKIFRKINTRELLKLSNYRKLYNKLKDATSNSMFRQSRHLTDK